jgi:hypothetical protein
MRNRRTIVRVYTSSWNSSHLEVGEFSVGFSDAESSVFSSAATLFVLFFKMNPFD